MLNISLLNQLTSEVQFNVVHRIKFKLSTEQLNKTEEEEIIFRNLQDQNESFFTRKKFLELKSKLDKKNSIDSE